MFHKAGRQQRAAKLLCLPATCPGAPLARRPPSLICAGSPGPRARRLHRLLLAPRAVPRGHELLARLRWQFGISLGISEEMFFQRNRWEELKYQFA